MGSRFLLLGWLLLSSSILSRAESPKLVVLIVVDQLSADQLLIFNPNFEEGGFVKLLSKGAYLPQVKVSSLSAYSGSAFASLVTGTTPQNHGIVSNFWIDSQKNGIVSANRNDTAYLDKNPRLLASTITDELSRLFLGKSKIGAIGLNTDLLTWAVGHSNTNYSYSINPVTGDFVSGNTNNSSVWVTEFNSKGFSQMYKQREWGPLNDLNSYYESKLGLPSRTTPFLYRFAEPAGFGNLFQSPFGNTLVRDFAVAMAYNEKFGKDQTPDFLTIQFSLKSSIKSSRSPYNAESEDMLLRLDHELAGLIRYFEDELGMDNVLFILTSLKNGGVAPEIAAKNNIPAGLFSGRKAVSLLNLYYMAAHGSGKYIETYHDGMFFLNHKLLKEKGISISDARQQTADFLIEMSGIKQSYTYDRLINNPKGVPSLITETFNVKRTGDVVIELEPGWMEELDNGMIQSRPNASCGVPVIFYGAGIKPGALVKDCQTIDIAPTICNLLKIPYPNGCTGKLIPEIIKVD